MKACRQCGNTFPLSEFYVHSEMADGHLNKCKTCVKKRVNKHRDDNHERICAYDRQRANEPHRLAATIEYIRGYRKQNPEKYAAHQAVSHAIHNGTLTREPCKVCGNPQSEAHHEDYSKPLDVQWVCSLHHKQLYHKKKRTQ